MGLLTDWIPDDPTAQNGLLALSAGLMSGRPAQGVMSMAQITSPENRAKLELTKAQLEDIRQQVGLRNIQLQQQTEQWGLVAPILRQYAARFGGQAQGSPLMSGGGAPAIPPSPGGPLGSGTFGIPTGGQAGAQPGQGGFDAGSDFGVPLNVGAPVLGFGGPAEFAKTISSYNAPTDFQKLLKAANIDPNSPNGRQALQQQIEKQNYIAPTALRTPIYYDPRTQSTKVVPPEQLREGYGAQYEAEARGKGNISSKQVWDPSANNGAGGYVFRTESQIADATSPQGFAASSLPAPLRNNNPGALMPGGKLAQYPTVDAGITALDQNLQNYGRQGVNTLAGVITKWAPPNANDTASYIKTVSGRLGLDPSQPIDLSNPATRHAIATGIMLQENGPAAVFGTGAKPQAAQGGPLLAAPPLGAPEGATKAQNELSQKWAELNAMNGQAQTTKSYLDSIKQLAQKAATGPFTDKLQFANALLAQVGSERAMDATTANKLLDKYGNQIVSRLGGSGGLSTDAARAILQSAYPNATMTLDAINEASDNLIGANSMIQAKARLLQQHANARDPAAYNQRELTFDQAADPRIWQLANMDEASAQKFLARQTPQVQADLKRRALALKQMGAL